MVVVGGANIDLAGYPTGALRLYDSNPGHITTAAGGAGRNIAENLVHLSTNVRLITAFGGDDRAQTLMETCRKAGIGIGDSIHVSNQSTGTYFAILNEQGDMQYAISDMAIFDQLTPDKLQNKASVIQHASAVVLDTNIPEKTIQWVCEHAKAPIFCDPVSTQKASKIKAHLQHIHTIKPNRIEAETLTGIRITDRASLYATSDAFLQAGIKQIFISLDKDGLFVADKKQRTIIPLNPTKVVNATGAGDAMMAAIVWAQMQGEDLETQAYCGLAAARMNVSFSGTVNTEMTASDMWQLAMKLDRRKKSKRKDAR